MKEKAKEPRKRERFGFTMGESIAYSKEGQGTERERLRSAKKKKAAFNALSMNNV